jgi:hypothetical protein
VLHLVILNRGWLQTARRHLNTCTTRLYAIVEGCKEAPKHLYDLVVLNCVEGCKKASGYVSNLATAGDAKCHNNGNCRRYQVSQQWPLLAMPSFTTMATAGDAKCHNNGQVSQFGHEQLDTLVSEGTTVC